ncbi:MAG: GGDEF domain-containing protein [Clostridiales bacterium]|nr:GGDEF domain-containing protein [Clostridiales bacterium]
MNTPNRYRSLAGLLFSVALVLFLLFFLYMIFAENISVTSTLHSPHEYFLVEDYSCTEVEDPSAPAGVKKEYRWIIQEDHASENCLCFFMVHQEAHVYFDGQLVYSMTLGEDNRIGQTISSNWVTVPLSSSEAGREITVVITPFFKSGVDFEPEFYQGSHYSIAFDIIARDLPQMFIATLCMVLGVIIIGVQLYFTFRVHIRRLDLIYLGVFAFMLGLWRITDLKCSPLLFSQNPMALGYISIGILFLIGIPFLLFLSTFFTGKRSVPMLILSLLYSVLAAGALLLQLCGAADFRQMLPLSHVMLIMAVLFPMVTSLLIKGDRNTRYIQQSWKFSLILTVGVLFDIFLFYLTDSSSYIIFALLAFIVYSLVVLVASIRDTVRKAYVDPRTGLANKLRWNDLLGDNAPVAEGTAMLMMDLNGLKQINDNYGHDTGDEALLRFSSILRGLFPSSSLISRWGGDEFAIMMQDMTPQKLERYLEAFSDAVDQSNARTGEPHLYFAVGYAFAADYPGLNHRQLLSKADELMYANKKRWYAQRNAAQG